MYLADYHVHSDYSDDSWHLMEQVIRDAIAMGLDEICFTEHTDLGVKPDWQPDEIYLPGRNQLERNVYYSLYYDEIAVQARKYQDQITVKTGIECGVQVHTIADYERLLSQYTNDFILLSIHQVNDEDLWSGEFGAKRTEMEAYQDYYQEMLAVVTQFKQYSALAHLDLIRRYEDPKANRFDETRDLIAEIFNVIIADGKGIELNTSSDRYGVSGWTPTIEILALYRDLGGEIITIGSDSHEKAHLGYKVAEAQQLLKSLGYRYFCTYDQLEPIYHQL